MMMFQLRDFDKCLSRINRANIFAMSAVGVALVGGVDYFTGNEVSFSLFYVGPVAFATWYAGRRLGIGIALLSCVVWYFAEIGGDTGYSHPAIPVWNAIVRLVFFVIIGVLLSALRKSFYDVQQLARTDVLTELYSRRAFEERLRHDLSLTQRRKGVLSLAYVDLDGFKAVNDIRGHAEGDRVLRATGRALRGTARETDTAARIGGDEFALVLPDTDRDGAERAIAKLRRGLQESLEAWPVTCSIGVITFIHPAVSPESAIAAADALMYEVKHGGKNAVAYRVVDESGQQDAAANTLPAAPR